MAELENNKDLMSVLWSGADILRSKMDANEYKNYLLGIVFYKYLSDSFLIKAYDLIYDEKPETLKIALDAYKEAVEDESGEELKEEISVATLEGRLQQLKQDLDGLRINYMILPDMNAGKGYLQIAYAAADAPKLKAWYELYQKTMLSEGTSVKNMKEMSWEDYLKTAGKRPSGEKTIQQLQKAKQAEKTVPLP